jgi:hypothetical protein
MPKKQKTVFAKNRDPFYRSASKKKKESKKKKRKKEKSGRYTGGNNVSHGTCWRTQSADSAPKTSERNRNSDEEGEYGARRTGTYDGSLIYPRFSTSQAA